MTASDWGPDSPATSRFRAFYDWPAPVEFEATLPDDLDGPEDERQFLLDEAPFAKVAAVRVERADLPPSVAAPGRTPATEGDGTPEEPTGDLRAEALKLARLLDPVAFDDRAKPQNLGQSWNQYERQQTAMAHAMTALIRDYRLVSEDEATVDRVAAALAADDAIDWDYVQSSARGGSKWARNEAARFRSMARAAVRALREGGVA